MPARVIMGRSFSASRRSSSPWWNGHRTWKLPSRKAPRPNRPPPNSPLSGRQQFESVVGADDRLVRKVEEQGLSGDEAAMAAFEENARDLSRVGGN